MERATAPPTSSTSSTTFEAYLRTIRKNYTVISLAQAVAMLAGRISWQPRCAVLTFDDSLKCTFEIAVPILERMGMTATVFISTETIETQQPYWWLRMDYAWNMTKRKRAEVQLPGAPNLVVERGSLESLRRTKAILRRTPAGPRDAAVSTFEQQFGIRLEDPPAQYPYAAALSWEDVQQLIRRGFSVGSHTVTHPNLVILNHERVCDELAVSKRLIEDKTGAPCPHVCYPYGGFNEHVLAIARDCGFEAATTTVSPGRNELGCELMALRRYSLPGLCGRWEHVLSGLQTAMTPRETQGPAVSTVAAKR